MDGTEFTVDPQRTCLQSRFFGVFAFDSRAELFAAVGDMTVGVDTIVESEDSKRLVYSGWVYWFLFLKGYLEFARVGELREDNSYLDYLVRYYGPRRHDPGLADVMASPQRTFERVTQRFALARKAAETAEQAGGVWQVEPVVVYADGSEDDPDLFVFAVGSTDPIVGKLVDGWHRLFVARLFEVKGVPARMVVETVQAA